MRGGGTFISEVEMQCLPAVQLMHLPAAAHPDRWLLAWTAAEGNGVVGDGQGHDVATVEDRKLQRAEPLGPEGVEP